MRFTAGEDSALDRAALDRAARASLRLASPCAAFLRAP